MVNNNSIALNVRRRPTINVSSVKYTTIENAPGKVYVNTVEKIKSFAMDVIKSQTKIQ